MQALTANTVLASAARDKGTGRASGLERQKLPRADLSTEPVDFKNQPPLQQSWLLTLKGYKCFQASETLPTRPEQFALPMDWL